MVRQAASQRDVPQLQSGDDLLSRLTAGLRISGCDRLTAAAIALTVLGWSLIWARALLLIPFPPLPLAILLFSSGLLLIPFRPGLASRNR